MKNERDVLASHLNAWMVQLAYSFQDPHYCYLAMEYCPGGDLRHLLTALGYLEEHEVRLYVAEMILAVFSLHSLGYIHRDLKPDNFLIDSKGHLKLTDFGLSKDGSHSNVSHRRFAQANSLPELSISSLQRKQTNLTTPKSSSISLSTLLTRPSTSTDARDKSFDTKQEEEKKGFSGPPQQSPSLLHSDQDAQSHPDTPTSPFYHSSQPFSSHIASTPLFDPTGWQDRRNKVDPSHLQSTKSQSIQSIQSQPISSLEASSTEPTSSSVLSTTNNPSSSSSANNSSNDRSYSVVGSPHYMSPEVLAGEHGYGTEVDWWSLGCIFFELVTGSPPFDGESPQQVFDNIIDWRTTLPQTLSEYSDTVSPECLDFITKLFLCDAKERFNVKMGLARVFAHPFFKDFSIESIFNLEPPFIPQLKDDCDTTYFDIATEDRLGTLEEQEKEKTLFEDVGNLTPPTSSIVTHTHPIQCPQTAPRRLTHSSRHFSPDDYWSEKNHHIQMTPNSHAPFEMYESSLPNIASKSHKEHLMFLGLSNGDSSKRDITSSSTKNYGRFTIQRTRALGTFTPLRRRAEAESPRRDIAGFTFQRKKSVRSFHPYSTLASSSELNSSQHQPRLDDDLVNASSSAVMTMSSTSIILSSSESYDFTSDEAIMRYATARRSPDHFFNAGSPNFGSNDFSTLYITPRALNFDADPNKGP